MKRQKEQKSKPFKFLSNLKEEEEETNDDAFSGANRNRNQNKIYYLIDNCCLNQNRK